MLIKFKERNPILISSNVGDNDDDCNKKKTEKLEEIRWVTTFSGGVGGIVEKGGEVQGNLLNRKGVITCR